MPFVIRNADGDIVAVSHNKSEEFTEKVDADSEELHMFLAEVGGEKTVMTETDLDFVRVVEDLVETLVQKHYIAITDLPLKAQEKMRNRKTLRGKMHSPLELLPDDDHGNIHLE